MIPTFLKFQVEPRKTAVLESGIEDVVPRSMSLLPKTKTSPKTPTNALIPFDQTMTSPREEENINKIKLFKHDICSLCIKYPIVINLDDDMDDNVHNSNNVDANDNIDLMICMRLFKSIMGYFQYFPKH